jgi:hypothetical protein
MWFEHYKYVYAALEREKQIKGWDRAKKIALIEQMNPSWSDLSEAWHAATADHSTAPISRKVTALPLSSRPKRSEVEGSAVLPRQPSSSPIC